MKRRGFLAGLLALPFAKPAIGAALNALERVGAPAVASRGRAYFDLASATSVLKELYSGVRIENSVYRDNPFMMAVLEPERFREWSKPVNRCRRNIEHRRTSPVASGYADWRDKAAA